ncbi:MAG: glucose-1-phosphate thymidylyltransferase [Nitrospinales bacterium]
MNNQDTYFDHLDDFAHKEIFEDIEFIWDPLKCLAEALDKILSEISGGENRAGVLEGTTQKEFSARQGRYRESCLLINDWTQTVAPVYFEKLGIFLDEGTILEPTAIIKGPAVIGKNCEIRQGAYIRGNALVGDRCVIGHATELKNTIMMNHTEAGHFNYIGDSILGSYVNLGAGSRLANLQFRTAEEKDQEFIHPITLQLSGEEMSAGMEKLGAVLGDYVELGCNTVTCPGTLVGKHSWIYPNTTLSKGFYRPDSFLAPTKRKIKARDR